MSDQRIKTYEKLLGYILIVAVILGIVSQLTGCGEYFKEESRIVVDYRHNEPYVLTYQTVESDNVVTKTEYQAETFELMWEITYQDGHKERKWETCTRFEYNNAVQELGDIENGNDD